MLIFPRKHGVAAHLEPGESDQDSVDGGPRAPRLLPNPAIDDPEVPDRIPIAVPLGAADLGNFGRDGSFAATFFGPKSLESDKIQNEDFALAGTVDGPDGPLSFGIVADGVTSRTFWPARASRIAAFAAYQAVKDLALKGWQPGAGDAGEVALLVERLCEMLEDGFSRDHATLMERGAIPSSWDEALYVEHRGKTNFWYTTTLLLVVIGRGGGWFVYCGDGGAVRVLADAGVITDTKIALESPATVELPTAVTIGVKPDRFTRVFIRPAPAGLSLHLILSSDGVDRSLRNKGTGIGYTALDLSSQSAAQATLEAIAGWPEADRDNMSLAHVCFPPDAPSLVRTPPAPPENAARPGPSEAPAPFGTSAARLPAATPEVRRGDDVPRRSWPGLALAVGLATGALAGSAITLVSLAAGFGHPLVAWLHDRLTGAPPVQSAAPAVVSVAPPASDPATRSVRPEVSPGEPIPAPVAEPRQTSAEAPAPPVAPVAAHEQSAPSDSAPAPASDATLPAPPEARPREPTATVLAEPDPATTGAPGRARLRGAIHEQPAPSPSSSQHVRKRESNVGEEPDDPAQCGASEDATEGDDDCDGAVP